MKKPIKVFWSEIGHRFYASAYYKQEGNHVTITGEKYDVTDDIAAAILKHDIEFSPVAASPAGGPCCPKCGKEPELEVFKAFHPTTIGTRAGCNHCGFSLSIDTTSGISAMKSLARFFPATQHIPAKVEEIAGRIYSELVLTLGEYSEGYRDLPRETWIDKAAAILRPYFPAEKK